MGKSITKTELNYFERKFEEAEQAYKDAFEIYATAQGNYEKHRDEHEITIDQRDFVPLMGELYRIAPELAKEFDKKFSEAQCRKDEDHYIEMGLIE